MKTRLPFVRAILWMVMTVLSVWPIAGEAQPSNAPLLSITALPVPAVSVWGPSGAQYQLQYAASLPATNWQVLTNFILGNTPFTMADPDATGTGQRLYRALMLATNSGVQYAPAVLTPGEVFRFTYQGSASEGWTETLVMSSATNGVIQRSTSMPSGASIFWEVAVDFLRVGPLEARLTIVRPPAFNFPAQTNVCALIFTGASSGFFQASFDMPPGNVIGQFGRDISAVGQELAPAQLTPGEIYALFSTNNFGPLQTNLVINTPTQGMLLSKANSFLAGPQIVPVSIAYERLGPLSGRLQLIAALPYEQPQTNLLYLIFSSPDSGWQQGVSGSPSDRLGAFLRDRSLVGQQLTSVELSGGEIFEWATAQAGSSNVTTLVVNSATSGMMVLSAPQAGKIVAVTLDYQMLGPLSSALRVIIPSDGAQPQTNTYQMVYSATNGGWQQRREMAGGDSGTFKHNRTLAGQSVVGQQLLAGEIYRFTRAEAGLRSDTTLAMASTSTGNMASTDLGPPEIRGPGEVEIQYEILGPLSCKLQVTLLPDDVQQSRTNWYTLVYSSDNSGFFEALVDQFSSQRVGLFTRDQTLVNQMVISNPTLPGELYTFMWTNVGIFEETMLLVNSAIHATLLDTGRLLPGGADGIVPVSLEYEALRSLVCRMQVVMPPSSEIASEAQTNTFDLLYGSTNGGLYRISTPSEQKGTFTRNQSLVGRQVSPLQLAAGESYVFTTTNYDFQVVEALVVKSATNGVFVAQANTSEAGFYFDVSFQFSRRDDWSGVIEVILPPSSSKPNGQTNRYTMIFTGTNGGRSLRETPSAQRTLGRFQRTVAP